MKRNGKVLLDPDFLTTRHSSDPLSDRPGGEAPYRTLGNEVFERLRADILSSRLAPGTKLRFDDLRQAYGVGLSPLREALSRRYYLQTITGIDQIRLEMGHLSIAARTDHGPRRFTMRWSQSHVQDFGERGKVLLDLDDNRYLVPDVEALSPRERDLFQRYVYW